MQKVLGLLLTIMLMLQTMFGLIGQKFDVYENIRYGEAERDLVTVYVPKSAYDREYNGCVLYIHGGSWTGGAKEDMAAHCKKIAMKGYVAATMSYSLCVNGTATDVTVYTMLDEVGACIQAIKDFGEEKGLNITKLATAGYSAGGHISMLYSYTRPETSPIALAFTANRVGPSDFSTEAWGKAGPSLARSLAGQKIVEQFTAEGRADEIVAYVSPVTYVTKDSVPSLFGYGALDVVVPAGNRKSILNAFQNAGATYDSVLYPLSGHGLKLNHITPAARKYTAKLFEYCEKYF